MDRNQRTHRGQFEIADLIDGAVSNAKARRNKVFDSEENLSELSEEQAENLKGGKVTYVTSGVRLPTDPLK